jgi:hypothetical protein
MEKVHEEPPIRTTTTHPVKEPAYHERNRE